MNDTDIKDKKFPPSPNLVDLQTVSTRTELLMEIERLTAENEKITDEIGQLQEALQDLFSMMDEKLLVRNISNDGDPLWSLHALNFTRRLAKAHKLIETLQTKDCDHKYAEHKTFTWYCHECGERGEISPVSEKSSD
ncbi:MAG: hypothetical protein ACR2PS_05560 [Pseudomonadales bacterium]